MSYDYVRRTYGVDPVDGHRVCHQVTHRLGTIVPAQSNLHYVHVRFDGRDFASPCHPAELTYLGSLEDAQARVAEVLEKEQMQPDYAARILLASFGNPADGYDPDHWTQDLVAQLSCREPTAIYAVVCQLLRAELPGFSLRDLPTVEQLVNAIDLLQAWLGRADARLLEIAGGQR